VDLAMDDAAIDWCLEVMRGHGFADGAWLPGWAGHDVLRMQRVTDLAGDELAPNLLTEEARAMCASILDELRGPRRSRGGAFGYPRC
jgi:hypothetical protein